MKKTVFLFSAIILSFAFIPFQEYTDEFEVSTIQEFIPKGKIYFSQIEAVEKSSFPETNQEMTYVDVEDGHALKYLSKKEKISADLSLAEKDYEKVIKLKGNFSYDIKKLANTIEFKSNTETHPNLGLNTETNTIVLNKKTYRFFSKMKVENSENSFGSAWNGFVYSNATSKVVLAKLQDHRFAILIQQQNKEPQIFIENQE